MREIKFYFWFLILFNLLGKSPEGFSADLTKAKEDLFSVLNEKCGVASGDQQEFIFGGTETGDHAYPWMAGLAYKLPGMDSGWLKFIYSEKATRFCEILTLLLPYIVPVKSRVKISQNFVASSEYMNFNQPESIPGNL